MHEEVPGRQAHCLPAWALDSRLASASAAQAFEAGHEIGLALADAIRESFAPVLVDRLRARLEAGDPLPVVLKEAWS